MRAQPTNSSFLVVRYSNAPEGADCAGCVVTCPHDVIGYEHEEGKYKPFHLEEELGLDNCVHGEKGCTTCTRACPRFRAWEPNADMHLFGRVREPDEMGGIWRQLLLTRAADDNQHQKGQDGGFVDVWRQGGAKRNELLL